MKKKAYFNESHYIIFDGTSYFVALGMDVPEILAEDEDCEVIGNPYRYENDAFEKCDRLNELI